jgi:hypothetical protein
MDETSFDRMRTLPPRYKISTASDLHRFRLPHFKLLALFLLLFVQLGWLIHSYTKNGMWAAHLEASVPRGTYFDMSGGYWIWIKLGPRFPDDVSTKWDERMRHRFGGMQLWTGGGMVRAVIVPAYWTIIPTLLPMAWISMGMLLSWRRHQRRGLCPTCGFDLRATPDI